MTSFRTIAGDPTKVVYNCYLSHQRPCHLQLSIASVKASVACECGKWQMARTWPVDVACVWPVYMWPVYVTAMCRARLQYYVGTCSDSHCSVTGASVVVITPCVYTYHTKSQHSKCDSHCSVTGASVVVITPCVYTFYTKSQHSKCDSHCSVTGASVVVITPCVYTFYIKSQHSKCDSHCSVTGASVVVITPCVYTYHTKSQHSKCATPIQTCIFSCVCPFFLIAHNLVLALQIIIMS